MWGTYFDPDADKKRIKIMKLDPDHKITVFDRAYDRVRDVYDDLNQQVIFTDKMYPPVAPTIKPY
jgi:hypothetical protein